MGGKSDLANREDRPESGGTDRKDIRSNSGMQERDKEAFAKEMAEERAAAPTEGGSPASSPFSIDNEPNNVKNAR